MAKEEKEKKVDTRVRNITFMLYEDSCNPDWQEILGGENGLHIPCLWIKHDKDTNPMGEPKKAHYHVILCFDGKKSKEQLQEIVDRLGGANGQYQPVANIRGMARYLCHLDNPEKYQYDTSEVHTIAMDYDSIIGMASDKYKAISEMIQFIKDNNIVSYRELMDYAMVYKYDWFKALCDNSTMVIKEYLKSRSWELEQQDKKIRQDLHLPERKV